MPRRIDLLKGVFNATRDHKVNWQESSSDGAYFAKVGNNRVEIVPPVTDSRLIVLEQIKSQTEMSFITPNKSPKKRMPIDQWRIIVYGDNGKVEIEIGQSNLANSTKESELTPVSMFKYIYDYASGVLKEKEENIIQNILDNLGE
ncbi:hypothetical protein EHF33_20735 (plasmid) [Deinococcus psychrotolerans]|uniref:Uncharacterized protein n=1 Tax=Deinococcus psychrotolerans TaxID=2489213 RepID=A0A3G8YJA0_9DEIO|nr:hypothetical protein [Deinococcus psychrotolerans]AZI45339.1 hypothetical protein EHF33_20735 [Deinococcus psychrotolerans]